MLFLLEKIHSIIQILKKCIWTTVYVFIIQVNLQFLNIKNLNADCNGAIGILRKLNAISDAQIMCLRNRGDVVSPLILKY